MPKIMMAPTAGPTTEIMIASTAKTMTPTAQQQEEDWEILDIIGEGGGPTAVPNEKPKLFPAALLADAEREALHIEIYNYFSWLEQNLISTQFDLTNSGSEKASNFGTSIIGVKQVLSALESGFKSLRGDAVVLNRMVEEMARNGRAPFLEQHCHEELTKRVQEVKDASTVGRFQKSWEDRYADLIQHQKGMNYCSYIEMNTKAQGLGDWLKKQRSLYARKDENFMKDRAPKLTAIPGFQWKQPPLLKESIAKPAKKKPFPTEVEPDGTLFSENAATTSAFAAAYENFPHFPKVYHQTVRRPSTATTKTTTTMASKKINPSLAPKNACVAPTLTAIPGFQRRQPSPIKKITEPPKKEQLPTAANATEYPNFPHFDPKMMRQLSTSIQLPTAKHAAANQNFPHANPTAVSQKPISSLAPQNVPEAVVKSRKTTRVNGFEHQFNRLMEYKVEHGDCNPPAQSRLGQWIYSMRVKLRETYGNKYLETCDNANEIATAAEADLSDTAIDPDITSVEAPPGRLGLAVQFDNDKEGAMISAVHEACSFKNEVNVGDSIMMIDGKSLSRPEDLAIGMDKSRTVHIVAKRKRSGISQDQVTRLNSIGFNWEGSRKLRPWELSFEDLLTYYQTHGDFRVPRTYKTLALHRLGEWVHNQRHKYSKKDLTFMKDRAPKLEAIGFEWVPRKDDFKSKFKELVDYKHAHGHVNVPCNNGKNSPHRNLGRWAHSVRVTKRRLEEREQHGSVVEEKKKGGHSADYLPAERIKLLDSIGFDWTIKSRSRKSQYFNDNDS